MKDRASDLKVILKRGLSEVLKPAGFSVSSAGYFRKQLSEVTQVVHICYYLSERDAQRYKNSGLAFSIELGVWFNFIPSLRESNVVINPKIEDCQFRSFLRKSVYQSEYPNGLVWSVIADASNVSDLVSDAKVAIETTGLAWFATLSQLAAAYLTATTLNEQMNGEGTWGMGNFGAPLRYLFAAFLAKRLGKTEEAANAFEELRKKNMTTWNLPRFEAALQALSSVEIDDTC